MQRVRKALSLLARPRPTSKIISLLAEKLDGGWGIPTAEEAWNELRRVSPMHTGMSYQRLDELGGIQWPCYDESHPGEKFIHHRLWKEPVEGPPAPFIACEWFPPVGIASPTTIPTA